MKKTLLSGVALAAALSFGGSAYATDAYVPMDTTPDWAGPYIYAGVQHGFDSDDPDDNESGVGAGVGFNWQSGDMIYGVEKYVALFLTNPDNWTNFQVNARLGTLITDNAMIYGAVGAGYIMNGIFDGETYIAVGGGLEVAINESMNWRVHAQVTPAEIDTFVGINTGIVFNLD